MIIAFKRRIGKDLSVFQAEGIAIYKPADLDDTPIMSTVEEIENAVKALPEQDFGEVLMSVLRRARELGR